MDWLLVVWPVGQTQRELVHYTYHGPRRIRIIDVGRETFQGLGLSVGETGLGGLGGPVKLEIGISEMVSSVLQVVQVYYNLVRGLVVSARLQLSAHPALQGNTFNSRSTARHSSSTGFTPRQGMQAEASPFPVGAPRATSAPGSPPPPL